MPLTTSTGRPSTGTVPVTSRSSAAAATSNSSTSSHPALTSAAKLVAWIALRPRAARGACCQADGQQGHPNAGGVEEIVAAFREHSDRMGGHAHRDQAATSPRLSTRPRTGGACGT